MAVCSRNVPMVRSTKRIRLKLSHLNELRSCIFKIALATQTVLMVVIIVRIQFALAVNTLRLKIKTTWKAVCVRIVWNWVNATFTATATASVKHHVVTFSRLIMSHAHARWVKWWLVTIISILLRPIIWGIYKSDLTCQIKQICDQLLHSNLEPPL